MVPSYEMGTVSSRASARDGRDLRSGEAWLLDRGMRYSALQRAQQFGAPHRSARLIPLLGIGAALLMPLLVLDLALTVQLIVSRDGREAPTDWVLGPWVEGKIIEWPFLGTPQLCLVVLVLVGAALAVLECVALVILQQFVERRAAHVGSQLRLAIHRQTFLLGPHELLGVARSKPEQLFAETTNAVCRGLALRWNMLPRTFVTIGCLLILAASVNFWLTLLVCLLALCTVRWYGKTQRYATAQEQLWRARAETLRDALLRTLSLARLRAGYDLDEQSQEPFAAQLQPLAAAELRLNTARALIGPMFFGCSLLATAFLLFVVGMSQHLTVAGTVLITAALIAVFVETHQLAELRAVLATADTAAAQLFVFLDRTPGVHESHDAVRLERLSQELALDHVTLANRNGCRLLDDVSLKLPTDRLLAVLASDSETPLALGGLLVRFYDPAAGRVLFDGQDIRQAVLDTVRGQALLVPREGLVFAGSVTENVICGHNGFTALEVNDALKRARVFDFEQQLPAGEATQLAAFDDRIPNPYAFRLGLARALVRDPSLIVLDEPSGEWSEDVAREHHEAILEARRNATVVVVPSQLDTLRNVDGIYLFHHGKLHDHGTHAELLQRSELYRHIIYVRFNPFRGEVD